MMDHLILRVMIKLFFAPILLFALYVQFHGDYGPGGGFQAGVIFASAFILFALGFGLRTTQKAVPPSVLPYFMVTGLLLYAGTGVVTLFLGGNFLDYYVLAPNSHHNAGQHMGIFLVELGVGMAVFSSMLTIFYYFAGREPEISDEDW